MKTGNNANRSQDIGTIMEMFGLQYSQAQQIYDSSNQDLNIAIQKVMDRQNSGKQQQKKETPKSVRKEEAKGGLAKMTSVQFEYQKKIQQKKAAEQAQRIQSQKRMRQRARESYWKQYINNQVGINVNKPLNYKKKTIDLEKQQSSYHFIPTFQLYLGKPSQVAFYSQLSEVFEQHWSSNKLILLHLVNLSDLQNSFKNKRFTDDVQRDLFYSFLTDVYLSSKYAAIFNKEFLNYGLDPKQFDFNNNPHLSELVNADKDRFCLLILRYQKDAMRVVVASKINIFEFIDPRDFQGFCKKINDKKRAISKMIEIQGEPCDPVAIVDKRKIEEDRSLRQMQEQEYMQMKEKFEGERKEIERKLAMKEIVQDKAKEREGAKKVLIKYKAEELKDPIQFKLRFPSGKQYLLHLPKEQKVEYIFTWIQCLEDNDLGFENNLLRSFDLIQPLQSLSLASHKSKPLQSIFIDSNAQVLIVRQN